MGVSKKMQCLTLYLRLDPCRGAQDEELQTRSPFPSCLLCIAVSFYCVLEVISEARRMRSGRNDLQECRLVQFIKLLHNARAFFIC